MLSDTCPTAFIVNSTSNNISYTQFKIVTNGIKCINFGVISHPVYRGSQITLNTYSCGWIWSNLRYRKLLEYTHLITWRGTVGIQWRWSHLPLWTWKKKRRSYPYSVWTTHKSTTLNHFIFGIKLCHMPESSIWLFFL